MRFLLLSLLAITSLGCSDDDAPEPFCDCIETTIFRDINTGEVVDVSTTIYRDTSCEDVEYPVPEVACGLTFNCGMSQNGEPTIFSCLRVCDEICGNR